MPKDEIDPEDPHALVGVSVEVADAAAAQEELARALVEEFVRLGHDEDGVLAIFRQPFHAGAHAILAARGEAYVRALALQARRRYRPLSGGL